MMPSPDPTERSDAALLAAWLAERDEHAFRALCDRHAGAVHAACQRLGATDTEAAVQAVFIVLAQRAAAVRAHGLTGWLLGTARRVVANQRRGDQRRRRREREAAMELARQRLPESDPAWLEARPLLDEALASLSDARREAVVRFYLEGQPQAMVAAELGCSVMAVKTRVHEGLLQLRRWFQRRGVKLGGVALASGLVSEAAAVDPALASACAQAACFPASAPAATALAKGMSLGIATKAILLAGAAVGLLAAGLIGAIAMTAPWSAASPAPAPSTWAPAVIAPALVTGPFQLIPPTAPAPGVLNARTFWFGNSWGYTGGGRGRGKWMQGMIADLAVAGGRIYAISPWDAHAGEAGIYTTAGDKVGVQEMDGDYEAQFHSWGFNGGGTLASDERHVYYATFQAGEGNDGRPYGGISRYTREGAVAGWDGSTNRNRLALFPGAATRPSGLAVHDGVLFASDRTGGRIHRIATATMTAIGAFACPSPGRLAVDAAAPHDLWVVDTAAKRVRRYGRDGTERGVVIADCVDPVALCIDARSGDLLVADGDPSRQQIRRYRADTGIHMPGGDFGAPVSAGPVPGRVEPGRFLRITGIQTDGDGSLYVACWDYGAKLWKFDGERRLAWVRQASEFASCADVDPADDTALVGAGHRYVFDASQPPGKGWTDAAITFDPVRYPDDPRVRDPWLAVRMLRIQGQPIMLGKTRTGSQLSFWRFDGEIAVPTAMYWPMGSPDHAYPPDHPPGPFLWSDANGDGRIQAEEYHGAPAAWENTAVDDTGSLWVNLHGWEAGQGSIARLACLGLDQRGVPGWSTTPDRERPIPTGSGIRLLSKMAYDAVNDRMYLGVWTTERPYHDHGWERQEVGGELQRFDAWSTAPKLAWTWSPLPPEGPTGGGPKAWSFERDYAFIGSTLRDGHQCAVDVVRLADGQGVGRLALTGDVGGTNGGPNMNDAIQSHRRADGTYLVLVEDELLAKGICFLWRPDAPPATVPAGP